MAGAARDTWAGVIGAVKTPLGLFALVLLVVEAVLGALAIKAEGADFTILTVGLIGIMATIVIIVGLVVRKNPEILDGRPRSEPQALTTPDWKYDAFIAAPMAGFSNDPKAYQKNRSDVLRLIKTLKDNAQARDVFYAGESLPSLRSFEAADLSLEQDLQALRASACLILIYPAPIVTSALLEAGVAIGLRMPVLIHLLDGVDLPFLLQHEQGTTGTHGAIHIYKYANFNDILHVYKANPGILRSIGATTGASRN